MRIRQSDLFRHLAELFHHRSRHLLHGLHAGELIGVREEIAFESLGVWREVGDEGSIRGRDFEEVLARSQAGVLYGLRDVEHVIALGNDHRVEVNIAMHQPAVDIKRTGTFIEEIFPSLQRTFVMKIVPKHESVRTTYHAGRLQFGRDPASGVAGMQKDKRLPHRRHRLGQSPRQPSSESENGEQQNCENNTHLTISLDEGWLSVVGHWSLAFGR